MKKLIIIALVGLFIIPSLANAFFFGISWYKDYKVEKNITESLVAGETDTIIVSFKNPTPSIGTLIAGLEVKEETGEHPIWLGDFKIRASLNSTSFYLDLSKVNETNCLEKTNGTFYCFNLTDVEIIKCFDFFDRTFCWTDNGWKETEGSFVVLPGSENNLTFYVTFDPALIPSNYTFNVSLFNDLFIPSIIDPLEHSIESGEPTLFNASEADIELWITTNEDKVLSVDVTLYEYFVGESFSPPGLIPIKFVGVEANDTDNITSTKIIIYYDDEEIPSFVEESSLTIYYYDDSSEDPDEWKWKHLDTKVNMEENYVQAITDHFSLFGIFGSLKKEKEIVYVREGRGGGGRTGGGIITKTTTATTIIPETTTTQVCQEKWTCTEWSECKDGIQTRTCVDENECGTDLYKPFESQPCSKEEIERQKNPLTAFIIFVSSPMNLALIIVTALILIGLVIFAIKKYPSRKKPYGYKSKK